MIKIKLTFGENPNSNREFDIIENELLSDAVRRILVDVPLPEEQLSDIFIAVVNGHVIESDLWEYTKLNKADNVLISPFIRGGNFGQIFKQVAIISITIAAASFLGVGGVFGTNLAGVALGFSVAGVSIAATLLLNSLIPPPVPDLGGLTAGRGYQESQTNNISGQSNATKRLSTVPKVYGTHRIFPNVAANPYTELDVDKDTGEQIQYLYVIYDFGFGPLDISSIKIGDTDLTPDNFNDYYMRLVDLNPNPAPTTDQERQTFDTFEYYKGDLEGDPISVVLTGNEAEADDPSTYLAIRNTAINTDGSPQDIILNFVNPQGLYSFNSRGGRRPRKISLEIMFSKVSENIWRGYNDLTYVSYFKSIGAQSDDFIVNLKLAPLQGNNAFYKVYSGYYDPNNQFSRITQNQIVLPGATKLLVVNDINNVLLVGSEVFLFDTDFVGIVTAIASYIPNPLFSEVTLDRPINNYKTVASWDSPQNLISYQLLYVSGFIRATTPAGGRGVIERDTTSPVYSSFKFTPKVPGDYKVRVKRVSTYSAFTYTVVDSLTWAALGTRFQRNTIQTDKSHLFLELKIRATNQLNGTIGNLSAVCKSVLDVYDSGTQTWSKQITANPAWVLVDLLTGSVNKRPLNLSRLDLDSISEWAEFCEEVPTPPPSGTYLFPRFLCNFILDYETTLQEVINQVTGAAQASLNIIDGKYGVLIDKLRTTPVQIFTPRNSRDFNSVRNYATRPDGLKIKYIDPDVNWDTAEIIAYDNGFTEANAIEIEDMTTFACTNYEQAWRFGRYMIAQNRLRQETMSILVDFEHIVCTRGDFVQITQDVMKVGGTPARVKLVVVDVVTIDDSLEIDFMLNYGYVFRGVDGVIYTNTLTPLTPKTFQLDGDLPDVGDLIIIGEVGSIVFDCLVKSISPNDDMSANIVLVEKADGVYSYESTDTLSDYVPQIAVTSKTDFDPPNKVENLTVSDFGYECSESGSGYDYFVELNWSLPLLSVYEYYSVLANYGSGYTEVGQIRTTIFRYIVNQNNLGVEHSFKVIAISSKGKKLELSSVDTVVSTPTAKVSPPSDVEMLQTNITNEVIQLSWSQIADCDVKEYRIRYSPTLDATWDASIPLLKVDRNATMVSAQARTGTYLIKAYDFNLNESVTPAVAITTIPNLFNLNVIEQITESPTFLGALDRIQRITDSILLEYEIPGPPGTSSFYADGYYYYNEVVDLGDIFTARIQSTIQAEGFADGDLMVDWDLLSNVLLLSNALSPDWDVETQYRTSDQANVIAGWVTMSSIAAINEGTAGNYSIWRPFTMSDATGRIFQFRLKLISNRPNVSPRVFDGTIKVDMADRVESYENLTTHIVNGYTVVYDPAFKGPDTSPNVQISIDGASSGDYWEFTNKNLEGFTIKFRNSANALVVRQFDAAIKGYGYRNDAII